MSDGSKDDSPIEQWVSEHTPDGALIPMPAITRQIANLLGVDPDDPDAMQAALDTLSPDQLNEISQQFMQELVMQAERAAQADHWLNDALESDQGNPTTNPG